MRSCLLHMCPDVNHRSVALSFCHSSELSYLRLQPALRGRATVSSSPLANDKHTLVAVLLGAKRRDENVQSPVDVQARRLRRAGLRPHRRFVRAATLLAQAVVLVQEHRPHERRHEEGHDAPDVGRRAYLGGAGGRARRGFRRSAADCWAPLRGMARVGRHSMGGCGLRACACAHACARMHTCRQKRPTETKHGGPSRVAQPAARRT